MYKEEEMYEDERMRMRRQSADERKARLENRRETTKRIPSDTRNIPHMQRMSKELDTTTMQPSWNDQMEAIQFTTQVETQLSKYINSDIVLGSFDEKERNFIIKQTSLAFAFQKQVPNKEIKDRSFKTIMVPVIMLALTKRNVDKNALLEIIGGVQRQPEALDEAMTPTMGQKAMDWAKGKVGKKEQVEE